MHPERGRIKDLNVEGQPFFPLEHVFPNHLPITWATQERFWIVNEGIQKQICNGVILASVPCGFMGD